VKSSSVDGFVVASQSVSLEIDESREDLLTEEAGPELQVHKTQTS